MRKSENFSEWFTQVVEKADLADVRYNVQGFLVHRTWSIKIIREIIKMFEKELERSGHDPVLFPLVIPEENLKKEREHFGIVPEVFWVTEKGANERLEKKLALRPTSETAFYPMYALWIRGHRDLPMKKYQTTTMYRHEPVTRPFIRGREFIWIEAHDAFATHEEALEQIDKDVEIMEKVISERLGVPVHIFRRPPWDKFLGADETISTDVIMPDGKVLQVGSTHDLGQKFSVPFGIKFLDANEEERHVWQTCYGPGIWRIFAALVSVHGDDKGLILPFDVSPVQIVIVPITYSGKDTEAIANKCRALKSELGKKYRVFIDDSGKTPGEKYNRWEMFGVPVRLEVGPKEVKGNSVTLFRRDEMKREKVAEKSLVRKIDKISEEMLENLKNKAKKFADSKTRSVKSKHDFLRAAEAGGIVRAAFCASEDCARDIQNETGGVKVRGTLFGKKEKALGKCVYCSKSAKEIVYFAKQY